MAAGAEEGQTLISMRPPFSRNSFDFSFFDCAFLRSLGAWRARGEIVGGGAGWWRGHGGGHGMVVGMAGGARSGDRQSMASAEGEFS